MEDSAPHSDTSLSDRKRARVVRDMPSTGPDALSVAEFCAANGIGKTTFFKLRKLGKAPRTMPVGSRVLISVAAAKEWRKAREQEAA
jgi:predicted DNA-binding transcriptional regulator AlpA